MGGLVTEQAHNRHNPLLLMTWLNPSALDMTGPNLVRSKEPPGYGVILVGENEIVGNYRDIPAV